VKTLVPQDAEREDVERAGSSGAASGGKEAAVAPRVRFNQDVAERLQEAADLLAATGGDSFRVAAYRRASDTVRHLDRDLREIAQGGTEALETLPGIGHSISRAILQLVRSGRWPYLDQLRGHADPVWLFQTIPGIGPELAQRIHDTLHVSTLEQLEDAAYRGRLEEVPGMGARRAKMVRAALAGMLSRVGRRSGAPLREPGIDLLLDVDREYRERARDLPKIAPRRFNPTGEAWLPVLHTRRGEWSFTALFSNTARAHELGKEHDWVVVFFSADHGSEGQRTIVDETHGALAGRRVVRGREAECLRYHQAHPRISRHHAPPRTSGE
jgi:putative hydrolase